MATSRKIIASVDRLFKAQPPMSAADITDVVGRLRENQDAASDAVTDRLYILIASWFIAAAIAYGFVTEGEAESFKLSSLQVLLVIAPIIIGFQYYLLAVAISHLMLLTNLLRHIYKRTLPEMYDTDLDLFLAPPSFTSIEGIAEFYSEGKTVTKLNKAAGYAASTIAALGGIAFFMHVAYLAIWHSGARHWWGVLTILIGAMPVVRAFLLIVTAVSALNSGVNLDDLKIKRPR